MESDSFYASHGCKWTGKYVYKACRSCRTIVYRLSWSFNDRMHIVDLCDLQAMWPASELCISIPCRVVPMQ